MARRSKKWDIDISKKLKKKSYRQEFFMNLIEEEGLSLREAIYVLAQTMGNKEFASLVDMPPSNASRSANPKNDVKWSTIEYILQKIGCELYAKAA